MQLETKKPVDARFSAAGTVGKDPMRVDAAVVTDLQRCRVNEGDAAAPPLSRLQVAA